MSLNGVLRTGVSGMTAQASKLATTADNIANANTSGYKRASLEFSTLVLQSNGGDYNSGGVTTDVRYAISDQGSLQYTTSATDLAVNGNGFFVVGDKTGTPYLTRAGAFVPDGTGSLINAAGYQLLGYPLDQGDPNIVANGLAGMQPVNVSGMSLEASASTEGRFAANLPSNAAVIAPADLPSANGANAQYTAKSSLVGYDNLGNEVYLDLYFAKTASEEWEVSVFDRAQAAAGGGFPYSAGPLATDTLQFDPTTGELTPGSASSLTLTVPNGASLDLDLEGTVQLAADYMVMTAEVNGNAPSPVNGVEIDEDGLVFALLENGTRQPAFRIPLANVVSPDRLNPMAGNIYSPTSESGDVRVGLPGESGLGRITSGALEQSNVDMATELVTMIESQRGYTANSKVFQTGAELLDVLINLKR